MLRHLTESPAVCVGSRLFGSCHRPEVWVIGRLHYEMANSFLAGNDIMKAPNKIFPPAEGSRSSLTHVGFAICL